MKGILKKQIVYTLIAISLFFLIVFLTLTYALVPYNPDPDFYINETANFTSGTHSNTYVINNTLRMGFFDDFNGGSLDTDLWTDYWDTGTNTVQVADGYLQIWTGSSGRAIKTNFNYSGVYNITFNANFTNASSTAGLQSVSGMKSTNTNPTANADNIRTIRQYKGQMGTIESDSTSFGSDWFYYLDGNIILDNYTIASINTNGDNEFLENGTIIDNDYDYSYTGDTMGVIMSYYESKHLFLDWFAINVTKANWLSETQTIDANKKLSNYTISYSNFNENNYIDYVEFLDSSSNSIANFTGGLNWNQTLVDDANLVSYYQAEDNPNDLKGINNGTNNGVSYSEGKYGKTFDFDGLSDDDYIGLGNGATLDFTTAFTVSTWVKTSVKDKIRIVAESRDTASPFSGWLFYENTNGQMTILVDVGASGGGSAGTTDISDNEWHHIVGTWDGSDTIIYIDGVQEDTDVIAGTISKNIETRIGIGTQNLDTEWKGEIDDFALFNRTLTADEILQIYRMSSQTERFISNTYLSAGSLDYVNDTNDMKIRTWLKGNGTTTPIINDIYGYYESYFIPDTISPVFYTNTTNPPTPMTYYPRNNIGFQINCSDETLNYNALFETGGSNFTMSNDTTDIFYYNLSDQGIQTISYKLYCNDSSGNTNSTDSLDFTINQNTTIYPQITIEEPTNDTYTTSDLWINATTDLDIGSSTDNLDTDQCWFNLSASNVSMTNSSNNWNYQQGLVSDGEYNLTVWCNNTNTNYTSNTNATSRVFTIMNNYNCWYGNISTETKGVVTNLTTGINVASTENLTCNDTSSTVAGNITVSGNLTFTNFDLTFGLTTDGEYNLTSNSGSNLTIESQTNITSNDTDYEFEIVVNSDTFIMQDSYLSECGYSGANPGLKITSPNSLTLENNTIHSSFWGIYVDSTNDAIVNNNTVYNNCGGIDIASSSNVNVTNNIAYNNSCGGILRGIKYVGSDNSYAINNTEYLNTYGMETWTSINITIINNTAYNNTYGKWIDTTSKNITVKDSNMYNNTYGAYVLDTCVDVTIRDNTITDSTHSGIYLTSDIDVILIDGNTITNSANYGIYVVDADNVTITNNNVTTSSDTGIYIYKNKFTAENNTIINTNVSDSTNYGIKIEADDVILTNNLVENSNNALYLIDSDNSTIENNTVSSNTIGIWLDSASDQNTVDNNNFLSNTYGIYTRTSSNNDIKNNDMNSSTYGIWVTQTSQNNNFTDNVIAFNTQGIRVASSSNNYLRNVFDSNVRGIHFLSSSNSNFTDLNFTNSTEYTIYHNGTSLNNIFTNINLNGTNMSFTGYEYTINEVYDVDTPVKKNNVSSYINVTNIIADSWLYLNLSYNETLVTERGYDENNLELWKYNESIWSRNYTSGINIQENYMYNNITIFSIWGIFGYELYSGNNSIFFVHDDIYDIDYNKILEIKHLIFVNDNFSYFSNMSECNVSLYYPNGTLWNRYILTSYSDGIYNTTINFINQPLGIWASKYMCKYNLEETYRYDAFNLVDDAYVESITVERYTEFISENLNLLIGVIFIFIGLLLLYDLYVKKDNKKLKSFGDNRFKVID